jgi:hypothetical protein
VELTKDIISSVDAIVDKYGEIKDNASLTYWIPAGTSTPFAVKSTRVLAYQWPNTIA